MSTSDRVLPLALAALVAGLACSAVPIMPDEASLATVSYVHSIADEAESDAAAEIRSELPGEIDEALVEDRRRIAQLQERVLKQEEDIEELTENLREADRRMAEAREQLQSETEAFRTAADEIEATVANLNSAIRALPQQTIEQLRDALDAFLEQAELPETAAGG